LALPGNYRLDPAIEREMAHAADSRVEIPGVPLSGQTVTLLPVDTGSEDNGARYSDYAKNRSQAAPAPILDALFAPALKAFPVSGLQCLYLPMNHASLYLAEHRFTFFQSETDRFRSDSCDFSLCH
jgi:hypothetical protein